MWHCSFTKVVYICNSNYAKFTFLVQFCRQTVGTKGTHIQTPSKYNRMQNVNFGQRVNAGQRKGILACLGTHTEFNIILKTWSDIVSDQPVFWSYMIRHF